MLHVVHHPDYVVAGKGGAHSFSKYAAVMTSLREGGAMTEHRPEPMPEDWLRLAHDPAYVSAVLAAAVAPEVERRIGFAVTPAVARRAQLSVGGTWLAARLALEHGYAANAAGGSHHARREGGAGYCVFNDLAVTALCLVGEGKARSVLIVDCDVHQGDGTAEICAGRPGIATFSIHAAKNFPVRKSRSTVDVALPDGAGDGAYLAALDAGLAASVDAARPDCMLYQAGVDVHGEDQLGRLALTDAGIAERDRLVAGLARRLGIPLAGTMGGGYCPDVAALGRRHAAVMRSCAAAYFG